MNLPSNNSGESRKKFSRGQFLRDSVIAASGIALMPSILSSCNKLVYQPGKGPGKGYGSVPPKGWGGTPTPTDLENAAANLTKMRTWQKNTYGLTIEYEDGVFNDLASTKDNGNWVSFIANIFIDMAVGTAGAVAAEVDGAGLYLAAFACLTNFLKDWGVGNGTPPDLQGTFGDYQIGHDKAETEIEQKLSHLVDPTNNYSNLLAEWEDVIEFNGVNYTLADLANSTFPGLGDEYNKLQTAALTYYHKSLWNLIMMRCCELVEYEADEYPDTDYNNPSAFYFGYAVNDFYVNHKGDYMRAEAFGHTGDVAHWIVTRYTLGVGGNSLPDVAAAVLFIDDVPGHIINPDGLWNRSYVFEQFSITKPHLHHHELAPYPNTGFHNFAATDDWAFTGGLFPKLTH